MTWPSVVWNHYPRYACTRWVCDSCNKNIFWPSNERPPGWKIGVLDRICHECFAEEVLAS